MTEALTVDAQRRLVADAHRTGIVNLQVLTLLSDLHQVLLAGHGRTPPGEAPQWTVPNTFVLPGELICDALERLCCQHLRIDPITCPVTFLGTTTADELDAVQYIFALNISGLPHVLAEIGADVGPHHWWNTEDHNELNLAPGIRRALASVHLLPPAGSTA